MARKRHHAKQIHVLCRNVLGAQSGAGGNEPRCLTSSGAGMSLRDAPTWGRERTFVRSWLSSWHTHERCTLGLTEREGPRGELPGCSRVSVRASTGASSMQLTLLRSMLASATSAG